MMVGSLSPNRVFRPERPCAICVVAEAMVGIALGHVLTLRTGYWLGGSVIYPKAGVAPASFPLSADALLLSYFGMYKVPA